MDQRLTHRCFDVVKPLRGNIHDPSQRGHLEQFINAKEKDYKEIYKRVSHNRSSTNDPPRSLNRDHGLIGC
jgi:hypothetical protein